ncbi:hypothetical protein [Bacillus sp. FJAT-27245]|uniref:hypothetical protein n=1 Tax=Bacillus sp. FJAT-27245 TaxID=1684144 RepID=UPI000A7AD024|nr:hypothetical protein [Bacillus sp. FJAT-27245]
MKEKEQLPSREHLDEAFHSLQDLITRITVEEEEEMIKQEVDGNQGNGQDPGQ